MNEKKFIKIMKRFCFFVAFGIITLFLINISSCKTAEVNVKKQASVGDFTYTYVDIDPIEVAKTWEKIIDIPLNNFIIEVYFRNPDKEAAIQFATLIVQPNGVMAYSYMVDGKINVFEFNPETKAYEPTWDTIPDESKAVWYQDYKTYFGVSAS